MMYLIHFMFKSRALTSGFLQSLKWRACGRLLGTFFVALVPFSAYCQIDAPAVIVTPQADDNTSLKELSYTCLHKQQIRKLFVSFPDGTPLPCTLDYHKVTESTEGRKTLWRARQDAQFCENKMIQMVEQFEEWGWDCSEP